MCSLCGNMGVRRDWADEGSATAGTPTLERQHRLSLANTVLAVTGLSLRQWGGRYLMTSRTGKSGLADSLSTLWPLTDRLGTVPLDPLDEDLLDWLEVDA
jgi:hypothetical protein